MFNLKFFIGELKVFYWNLKFIIGGRKRLIRAASAPVEGSPEIVQMITSAKKQIKGSKGIKSEEVVGSVEPVGLILILITMFYSLD